MSKRMKLDGDIEITYKMVDDLRKLLEQSVPAKAIYNLEMMRQMRGDKENNNEKYIALLGSAYDWLRFGT